MDVDPREALPAPLRHGIDQTIAAERLEGWQPTAGHIRALVDLIGDAVTFGDYLASYRARYPPAPAEPARNYRRVFRRARPYLVPGTTLLRNNFGADSHDMLADLEFVATAGRMAGWHRRLAEGEVSGDELDVRGIHQQMFADVYPWAGNYRVTELRRGDMVFAWRSTVAQLMARVEDSARRLAVNGSGMEAAALAYELARLYADYNHVHPFREGNGRTGTLMLHTVMALAGRQLDLSTFSRDEWYSASRDSMPFRRDGRANHRPFLPLFVRALG